MDYRLERKAAHSFSSMLGSSFVVKSLCSVFVSNVFIYPSFVCTPNCRELLGKIKGKIVFQWVPSHCGLWGNERADFLAKKGTGILQNFRRDLTLHSAKLEIKRIFREPFRLTASRVARDKPWSTLCKKSHGIPSSLRAAAVAKFRLLTGHDCLCAHLFRFNLVTSPICVLCDTGQDMTAAHLDECSALNDLNCIVKRFRFCLSPLTKTGYGNKAPNYVCGRRVAPRDCNIGPKVQYRKPYFTYGFFGDFWFYGDGVAKRELHHIWEKKQQQRSKFEWSRLTLQDSLLIWFKQSPDNAHSVAFSQRSSSPRLNEDDTFNDSDIINNLIDYEDGPEEPDSLRVDKNMQCVRMIRS
ncbi:uncharacterized protein LOC103524116 [Trichonephila clavipes]|uniref:Uncharacterized protein LOC103524116 n=1 Tax=Trichonephila clavipes TaxID=2585209 RepID=A0A8X6WJ60_TRICX|nr:uncharacterized protein LOC103524116 [Trichonephila clavipes]